MSRPMYEIPKPRKNAKKVIENPIVKPKRKKVVLNFDMQAFLRNKQFEITTHQSTIEDFIG